MKKLMTVVMIIGCFQLMATNYYVATNGTDASGRGTFALPYLTIQYASEHVLPGDSVIVRDGTYTAIGIAFALIYCNGTAGNEIVFKSEHKWGAVVTGANTAGYGISPMGGASYLKFIDFEIKDFTRSAIEMNNFYEESPGVYLPYTNSYITIQGCKIHNIGRIVYDSNYGLSAIYVVSTSHHIVIDGNLIYNIGRTGGITNSDPVSYLLNKDHAIYIGSPYPDLAENAAHHITITNNIMYNISGCHITMGSNNDLIANNVLAWVDENFAGANMFIWSDSNGCFNETIVNNIFYQLSVQFPYAIQAYDGVYGWTVKNNMVYGGQLFYGAGSVGWQASMQGGNYGQTDCENGEVNPLFVSAIRTNVPNVDFRLQPQSPAINAGANVGLTTDFLGNPIVGLPDIGAYEYQAASTIGKPLMKYGKSIVIHGKLITR